VFEKVRWNESMRHGENEEFDFAAQARQHGLKYSFCPEAMTFLQYHHCDAVAVISKQPQTPDQPCREFLDTVSLADKEFEHVHKQQNRNKLLARVGHKLVHFSAAANRKVSAPNVDVSILVCVNRYLQRFRVFAQSICQQEYDLNRVELIVANPHSPDGLSDYIQMLDKACGVRRNGRRVGPAICEVLCDSKYYRNRGMLIQCAFDRSCGRVVIGMDADLVLPRHFLQHVVDALTHNPDRVVGVYRSFLTAETTNGILAGLLDPFKEFERYSMEDCDEVHGFRGVLGYCQAVLRDKWGDVGYPTEFDNIAQSDVAFVDRLAKRGVTPLFLKDLKVLHLQHPRDWAGTNAFL
jgi:hypothetical protein